MKFPIKKFPVKSTVVLVILGAACAAAYAPIRAYWNDRRQPNYRQLAVTRGTIVSVVNSTGTVQPVVSVSVGSFVSGPITELFVDFNDVVKKDQLLARIDPRLYEANVARDKALLATKDAELERAEALWKQAANDLGRAKELHKQNPEYISATEMDQFFFNHEALEKQIKVAKASVKSARASLDNSKANLEYTEITSPVDGIIVNRKIDRGQTLAAQFQTPELFIVAPDMRTKMHILASVDEADIGLIREAQRRQQPVTFTVDAYPNDLFEGKIFQIRMSAAISQNVVTYPVMVEAANTELKLLPGMTASLSFQVDKRENALCIPNAALRFYPPRDQVRPEDRKLLEGVDWNAKQDDDGATAKRSAVEKAEARRNRNRRHVWVVDGQHLRAVEVVTGISDNKYTELVSGELAERQQLVTGLQPAQ